MAFDPLPAASPALQDRVKAAAALWHAASFLLERTVPVNRNLPLVPVCTDANHSYAVDDPVLPLFGIAAAASQVT